MGRQWCAVRIGIRAAIFGNEITGGGVGEERADEAEDHASERKGDGVGQDLLIQAGNAEIVPVECRHIGSADQQRAAPVGSTEDGNDGPWIIDERAGQECDKIKPEQPGEQADENHMKTVGGTEGNEHAECKGKGRALGRFLKVQDLAKECAEGSGISHVVSLVTRNGDSW